MQRQNCNQKRKRRALASMKYNTRGYSFLHKHFKALTNFTNKSKGHLSHWAFNRVQMQYGLV